MENEELKIAQSEYGVVESDVQILDVAQSDENEIKKVLEGTPEGLFTDLVDRSWSDFCERVLYRYSHQTEEAFQNKKFEVLEDLYGDEFLSFYEENNCESLDVIITDFLYRNGRILHLPSNCQSLWYAPQEIHEAVLQSSQDGLISPQEKEALREDVGVVIGGVSVGSSVAKSLSKLGVGNIKGFDTKTVGLNHLSRMDVSAANVGKNKARAMYEDLVMLNPYANWEMYDDKIDSFDLEREDVWGKDFSLKILVDAIDDPNEKINMRRFAFKNGLIVLMATDIGNGRVILDCEDFRFGNKFAFGGKLDVSKASEVKKWRKKEGLDKIDSIVDFQNLNLDMVDALAEVKEGKHASFPQLGLTSQMAGSAVSNTVLNLLRGRDIKQRSILDFNRSTNKLPGYLCREVVRKKKALRQKLK